MRWIVAVALSVAGCTCRSESTSPRDAGASATPAASHDLALQRATLVAFGNSTPLPLSEEFTEEVPGLRPPLERAAASRGAQPLRVLVARDVPYGQLTRLMQAALQFRVVSWELQSEDALGAIHTVFAHPPSPTPRGSCWARAWVGPDARVLIGLDLGGDSASGMTGVLVNPRDDRPRGDQVVSVVRRLDARCKAGDVRLYSQPTARSGPVLDLARAFSTASPAAHLSKLTLAVPSIGHLDNVDELVK